MFGNDDLGRPESVRRNTRRSFYIDIVGPQPGGLLENGYAGLSLPWEHLREPRVLPLIEDAHGLGLTIFTWTVNDRQEMVEALASGVDSIITDDPGALTEIRSARSSRTDG